MYRLIGRLEQGELADLFRAERVDSKQPVVVKLFHGKTTDAAYARVVAETARQLRAVEHRGVVHVVDIGLAKNRLAVVREDAGRYTLGLVLQRLLTREVHLPPALAMAFVLELLDVVQAAHAAGIVHGALTPGNVLVGEDGRPSVAEFGALAALQSSVALRKLFAAKGRSSYRAPELKGAEEATVASDLYALGAITYELLTLREASTGSATVSTRSERLPPPSRLVRRLNSRVDPVIMRALETSPARRYRSAAELAEAIKDFLSANGGIPGRDELKKFVAELFPNEVNVSQLGPVPFEGSFALEDIDGVGTLEESAAEVPLRPSFSGGEVDDRTPTSDGLPVFRPDADPLATQPVPTEIPEPLRTEPSARAVAGPRITWDAPAGELPAAREQASGAAPDQLMKRVRVVEDFEEDPKRAKRPAAAAQREREIPKTVQTFAVPFKRAGDPELPDFEKLRAQARRRSRVVAFIATLVLFGTLGGMVLFWYRSTSNWKATLLSYLPDPIERQVAPNNRPPPPINQQLKLPEFEKQHPELALPGTEKPKQPEKPPPPPPKDECYAPKGKTATLHIATTRAVSVEIDGDRVCGAQTKIAVAAGSHKVRVVDTKSQREYVTTTRFEAGKQVKLAPVFK